MPNHVDFDLIVSGDLNSLLEFEEHSKEERKTDDEQYTLLLSANKYIPYPDEYRVLDELAKIERKKEILL